VESNESLWAGWMRAANAGDEAAYRRLLQALAGLVRAFSRQGCARAGLPAADAEDIVQETLLAIHLKRHTWDERQPLLPWARAIARNKLIDNLRRKGRRVHLPIDDFLETLPAAPASDGHDLADAKRLLRALDGRQRQVVEAISVEGASIRETAARLGVSEGAVRVALHRGLKALAAMYEDGTT